VRKFYIISILTLISFIISGCVSINPFASNTFVVKEGYLSLGKINNNIAKQMPLEEKIGSNKIKIVNTNVYASQDKNSLLVEAEFIFTSFEIPEGLPSVAKFKSSLEYNPQTKEFKLARLKLLGIRFLKESLVEYITPQQKRFIPDTLMVKLYSLVLHKSKKRLKTIKSIEVKDGKIKVYFN